MQLRAIRPGEAERFAEHVFDAFDEQPPAEELTLVAAMLEPERCLVAEEDGAWVATAGASTRELTLPGGATAPCLAVAFVTTLPTHRRRGLLRALLGRLHDAAPEPVAALWPSEGAIYGRFGYGPAAWRARLTVDTARVAFRDDAPPAAAVRLARRAADAAGELARVHEAQRRLVPGVLDRPAAVWARRLADLPARRGDAGPLRAALLEDGSGYALFAVGGEITPHGAEGIARVTELVAHAPEARAALWRFLCSLDLVRTVEWPLAPVDEPLPHLLRDPRAVRSQPSDALWVAALDVPRALAARRYAAPVDVVLDAGGERVRLRAGRDGDAECVRADRPPDVRLDREALGSVLLGGTPLHVLAAAGRARGELGPLARALRTDRAPWPAEQF